MGCTAWPVLSGSDLPSSAVSVTIVSGCQRPRATPLPPSPSLASGVLVGCGLSFLGTCGRRPESVVGSAEGTLPWPLLRELWVSGGYCRASCLAPGRRQAGLRGVGRGLGPLSRAGPSGGWSGCGQRNVHEHDGFRLGPTGAGLEKLVGGRGLWSSVMRPRLFRKARDPDAWQWAGGWHAPWGPPQAYFHLQALWAGAVWVFLWKRRFLGPCRWLAGSRLATVVMPGGFCQLLFRAVCQAAGGTGQPSRSGDPLVSGASCCGGPWQGPKAPVPPALRQRGPGGAPS